MQRCATDRITRGVLATLLIGCLCVQNLAIAEDLPTTGTFEGVYHRDRWGVGHFLFFIVHPDLHERLSKYEDKLIRLKVTKGTQPMNPGSAIMLAVGEIEELPQPPLEIRAKTRPSKVTAGQPFQLVVEVTNKSKDDSLLYPIAVLPKIRQSYLQPGEKADDPSWLIKEYTVGQLSISVAEIQLGGWQPFQGRANLKGRGGQLLLSPGASDVWVTSFPKGVSSGDGELKIDLSYALAEPKAAYGDWKSQGRFEVWKDFPVSQAEPGKQPAAENEALLSVSEVHLTPGEDGWTNLQFRLHSAKGKTVRVPGTISRATGEVDSEKFAHIARLQGIAADGSAIEIEAVRFPERDTRDGIERLLDLPEAGAIISAKFRKESRFASPMKRLVLNVITDNGVEPVVLSDDLKDADVPPAMPFGPPTAGVKIRIRPAKTAFEKADPLRFNLQAVNVSGKPVCWWRPFSGLGKNVIVEIDGKRIEQPDEKAECMGGWAAQWTCKNPREWTVTLPDAVTAARGRHTLRYIIVSNGGHYKNADNEMIPIVRGRIASNEVEFTVE